MFAMAGRLLRGLAIAGVAVTVKLTVTVSDMIEAIADYLVRFKSVKSWCCVVL